MNRLKLNYVIDFLMAISFIIVALTGLILFFSSRFLGIARSTLKPIHDWAGVIMVGLMLIHIISHWNWVVNTTKNFFKPNNKKLEENEQ